MVAPLPVREFASVAEMQAHYAAVRQRCFNAGAAPVSVVPAPPREVAPAEVDRYRDVRPAALPNEAFRVPTQRQLAGKARYSGIEILALTAEVTGIGTGHLRSSRRTPPVVKARQIAMWAMYRHCGFGLPEVGRKLGGKDHTTVLHATRKIAALAAHLGISLDGEPGEVVASLWSAEWPTINVKALRAMR